MTRTILPRRLLTKSLFQRACACPRKLILHHQENYKTKPASPFLQSLSRDGRKLERYAKTLLFPDGILVGSGTNNHDGNVEHLVQQTKHLLDSNEDITLLEGAFVSGPCFMRADVLHKHDGQRLDLMEIKSKAWNSLESEMVGKRGGIKSEFLPYIRDVAFQKLVLRKSFPNYDISCFLVMPDTSKMNMSIPNLNQMFDNNENQDLLDESSRQLIQTCRDTGEILVTKVNVDDLVEEVLSSPLLGVPGGANDMTLEQAVTAWGDELLMMDDEQTQTTTSTIQPCIGSHCRDCEFRTNKEESSGFSNCWQTATGLDFNKQEDLIIDIHRAGKKSVEKWISTKKYTMSDITTSDLKLEQDGNDPEKKKYSGLSQREKQWLQVKEEQAVVLDRSFLQHQMETWQYPWHFVDFETITPVLPFTTQKRPFQMLAFQFSHHVMQEDGKVEHVSEFLHAIPGKCPNRAFLEALAESLSDVGTNGTVFRWGSHENTVLSDLLEEQSDQDDMISILYYLESLIDFNDNAMVDLMRICEKGYYAPGSGSSSSIKKLLLPTMRASKVLQQTYNQPIYTGKNFTNMTWWQENKSGELCDPYALLGEYDESSIISQGGDAIVAYNMLQNSRLDAETRSSIEKSLLRYCELDTLAMVMITQGLLDLMEQDETTHASIL